MKIQKGKRNEMKNLYEYFSYNVSFEYHFLYV